MLGLHFELLETGITVEEDVGTVELCVTYGGDNVPQVIDARFQDRHYGINLCIITHQINLVYLGDDIIFSGANSMFTLATGDRRCFNVTIVDDDEIEYDKSFVFGVKAVNTSLSHYSFDFIRIYVRDNEGQLHLHHNTDSGPKLISVKQITCFIDVLIHPAFRFGLEMSSYSVVESDGVVSVCVTADRGDGSEIYTATINITTQGMAH